MTSSGRAPSSSMSTGTTARSGSFSAWASSRGLRAARRATTRSALTRGCVAAIRSPSSARAKTRSSCAMPARSASSSGRASRTASVSAASTLRISLSSSRIACTNSLFASTTPSGSMKSVAPLCDRSWTMPRIRLFAPAATGRTKRPWRTVTYRSWKMVSAAGD